MASAIDRQSLIPVPLDDSADLDDGGGGGGGPILLDDGPTLPFDQYVTNVAPSPYDPRDYVADGIFAAELEAPLTLDLRSQMLPVRNQGQQGTCAAMSTAAMKEWQEKKELGLDRYFAPQFIYNLRENQGSEGMIGRDLMKILNKTGAVLEADYKYGRIEPAGNIPPALLQKAANYRIEGYAIVQTIDGLKKALWKNGPCYISFPVYNTTTRMWKPQNSTQKQNGGHAMLVVGYDEVGFIIRNSWGTGFGNKGYCTYFYEDFGSHWEIWTCIDAASSLIDDRDRKVIVDNESSKGCCGGKCAVM